MQGIELGWGEFVGFYGGGDVVAGGRLEKGWVGGHDRRLLKDHAYLWDPVVSLR